MTISAAVRRACYALALASFTHTLAAQSAQVAVADAGHRYLSLGMQGFESRRRAGFGQFIPDSVLRASSGARLSHVLTRYVPSVFYGGGSGDGEYPISSRVCNSGVMCSAPRCYVRVFVDGSMVFDGNPRTRDVEGVDVSRLRPEDLSGVEFYATAAGLPSQYAGYNADCGTLLFWSRET
jgi:hypothetical protein